jgi:hypothetical protein
VDAVTLEAARDSHDPRAEIIALIMAKTQAAVAPPKQLLAELKVMSLKNLRGEFLSQHLLLHCSC